MCKPFSGWDTCFHCFFAGVVAKGVHLSPLASLLYVHYPECYSGSSLLALSPLSSMSIIPNVIRAHHLSPLCPLPRITFGYIVPRYQSSLAVPSASKSFERVLCCCTRNCCWFMLFVLLISLSATCFAFASGLANILASKH